MNLKEKIKATNDRKTEVIHVPEWDCEIHVRGMSGTARDEFEMSMQGRKKGSVVDLIGVRAHIVIATAYDADGEKLFEPADADWLSEKSGAALDRLAKAGQRLSGLSDDDVDELEKN